MNKTVKDKIIERLNKGFGFSIPIDAKWTTHQRAFRSDGAQSWYFNDVRIPIKQDVGACSPATECLKWKRWYITSDKEICEYSESYHSFYEGEGWRIEKK